MKEIMTADSYTFKLSSQQNGWKGVCINHYANGDFIPCPVGAIGRQFVHISVHAKKDGLFLSSYWVEDDTYNVTDVDIRVALKFVAGELNYSELKESQ